MSDLDKQFTDAAQKIELLKIRPSDNELTYLYKYYKQATIGDVNIECPAFWNWKGQIKWKSWESVKGTTQEQAKKKYIEFANGLFGKYKM